MRIGRRPISVVGPAHFYAAPADETHGNGLCSNVDLEPGDVWSVTLFGLFGRYGEAEARRRLPVKLLLVAVMAVGVRLIS